MIILGQRGFGLSDFLNSFHEALEGQAYIYAVGTAQGLQVRKHAAGPGSDSVATLATKLDHHRVTPDAINGQRQALAAHVAANETLIWLTLRDLAALGMVPASELLGELRGLCERWPGRLRVVAIGQSEALFTGSDLGSSFLALSHEYRLGWLDDGAIERRTEKKGFPSFAVGYSKKVFAGTVLAHTGGVPLLVDDLLRRINALVKDKEPLRSEKVLEAVRNQRSAPPPETWLWQQGLREILLPSPELTYRLRAYAAGQDLDMDQKVPRGIERPLFVGGWVRERRDEGGRRRWGMSSTLHASQARAVLDDLVQVEVTTSPAPGAPA